MGLVFRVSIQTGSQTPLSLRVEGSVQYPKPMIHPEPLIQRMKATAESPGRTWRFGICALVVTSLVTLADPWNAGM